MPSRWTLGESRSCTCTMREVQYGSKVRKRDGEQAPLESYKSKLIYLIKSKHAGLLQEARYSATGNLDKASFNMHEWNRKTKKNKVKPHWFLETRARRRVAELVFIETRASCCQVRLHWFQDELVQEQRIMKRVYLKKLDQVRSFTYKKGQPDINGSFCQFSCYKLSCNKKI